MAGRFWTLPFFISVIIIALELARMDMDIAKLAAIPIVAVSLLVTDLCEDKEGKSLSFPGQARNIPPFGIVPERSHYFGTNALFNGYGSSVENHPWAEFGKNMAAVSEEMRKNHDPKTLVIETNAAGMPGFYSGPHVIIIDHYALADPLLARLPCDWVWRPGHCVRNLPPGYTDARNSNDMSKMDLALAQYYKALSIIVSDPVFSPERLKTMVLFHAGYYDHFLSEYLQER